MHGSGRTAYASSTTCSRAWNTGPSAHPSAHNRRTQGSRFPFLPRGRGIFLYFAQVLGHVGCILAFIPGGIPLSTVHGRAKMCAWRALKFHTGVTSLLPCAGSFTDYSSATAQCVRQICGGTGMVCTAFSVCLLAIKFCLEYFKKNYIGITLLLISASAHSPHFIQFAGLRLTKRCGGAPFPAREESWHARLL